MLAGMLTGGATRPTVKVSEVERGTGENSDTAQATMGVTWNLPGGQRWTYDTFWTLVEDAQVKGGDSEWRVSLSVDRLFPAEADGGVVRLVRVPVGRGRILDTTAGRPLVAGGTVTIGIRKREPRHRPRSHGSHRGQPDRGGTRMTWWPESPRPGPMSSWRSPPSTVPPTT